MLHFLRQLLILPFVGLAWLGLRLIDWSIRRHGVRRCYGWLARTSPAASAWPGLSSTAVSRVGRVVRRANGRREGYCLRRALLIWWLLRWFGVSADIYCDTGIDKGHAWVEAQGRVVGDRRALQGTGRFGRFSTLFGTVRTPP